MDDIMTLYEDELIEEPQRREIIIIILDKDPNFKDALNAIQLLSVTLIQRAPRTTYSLLTGEEK